MKCLDNRFLQHIFHWRSKNHFCRQHDHQVVFSVHVKPVWLVCHTGPTGWHGQRGQFGDHVVNKNDSCSFNGIYVVRISRLSTSHDFDVWSSLCVKLLTLLIRIKCLYIAIQMLGMFWGGVCHTTLICGTNFLSKWFYSLTNGELVSPRIMEGCVTLKNDKCPII